MICIVGFCCGKFKFNLKFRLMKFEHITRLVHYVPRNINKYGTRSIVGLTMDSSAILTGYLSSRSNLQSIITYGQFEKLFPLNTSQVVVLHLYSKLCLQRQTYILEPVERDIANEFHIPVKHIAEKLDLLSVLLKRSSIHDLIIRLTTVLKSCKLQDQALSEEITSTVEHVKILIDELNDLRFGKSTCEVASILEDAERSFDKLDSYLERTR